MEAIWDTAPAPAPMGLVAIADPAAKKNIFEIDVPWLAGIIATRSLDTPVPGLNDIIAQNKKRIESGLVAVKALEQIRADKNNEQAKTLLAQHEKDLGFGLLTKKYEQDTSKVTPEIIQKAADDSIPWSVNSMFYGFRLMVFAGVTMILLFAAALFYSLRREIQQKRWLLYWALLWLPMPWIACEAGWFVAEYGRQPWTIWEVLPTHLSVSSLSTASLWGSIGSIVVLYTGLLIVEFWLMVRFAKIGPSSLGTGAYHHETTSAK
jgi:cytochrome d ubiquinol oxidase subunit I